MRLLQWGRERPRLSLWVVPVLGMLGASAAADMPSSRQLPDCRPDQAVLTTPDGRQVVIAVELAQTPATRERGLMYRTGLEPQHGMLFLYEQPGPVAFWMKNTPLPLDLLFFDAAGVLRHLHPQARPLDETIIPGAAPADPSPDRLAVLEIAGGEGARLALPLGSTLSHSAMPQDVAATPCAP